MTIKSLNPIKLLSALIGCLNRLVSNEQDATICGVTIKSEWTPEEENKWWQKHAQEMRADQYSAIEYKSAAVRYVMDCRDKGVEINFLR